MTNKRHTVLYTGVTSDLVARVQEHRNKTYLKSFTGRYNVSKLLYFNVFSTIEEAIFEEKRIKGGSRKKKIDLVNGQNPEWKDLWEDIKDW